MLRAGAILQETSPSTRRTSLSIRTRVAALAAAIVLTACAAPLSGSPSGSIQGLSGGPDSMTVYRNPDCSCCHLWADIATRAGWAVASVEKLDMTAFKAEAGVPREHASCHTTMVAGYFVEGHVPLEAVEKLLAERPEIDGIALPGMPPGSPGMGGVQEGPFAILAITDGVATLFGSY